MTTITTKVIGVAVKIDSGVQHVEVQTTIFESKLIFRLSDLSVCESIHVTRLEDLTDRTVELDVTESPERKSLGDCVVYEVKDLRLVDDVDLGGMHPEFYQIDHILNEVGLHGDKYKDIWGQFESVYTVSGFKFYIRKDRLYPLLGTYKLKSSSPDIETRERRFNYTDASILKRAYICPLMYSEGDIMDRYTLNSGKEEIEVYPGGVPIAQSVDLRITKNMIYAKLDKISDSSPGRSSAQASREAYNDYVDMMNDYNIHPDG